VSAKGKYEVMFETANKTSIKIIATVTEQSVVNPDPTIKEKIAANDFMIGMEDVSTLSDAKLKELAKVEAVDLETGADIAVTSVNHTIAPKKGKYTVAFETANKTSIQIVATVIEKSVANPDPVIKEQIVANDFMIGMDEIKGLTDAKVKDLAKAQAVNLETGADVAITSVTHKIVPTRGRYEITFSTANKTSIKVMVTVTDKISVNPNPAIKERINANNFTMGLNELQNISKELFVKRSISQAFDEENFSDVEIVDYTVEKQNATNSSRRVRRSTRATIDEKGIYNISFMTAKGTTATVELVVQDFGVDDGTVYLTSDNQDLLLNDFKDKKINEVDLKNSLDYNFVNSQDGSGLEIKNVSPININSYGLYNVTINGNDTLAVNVDLMVHDVKINLQNAEVEVRQGEKFDPKKDLTAQVLNILEIRDITDKVKIESNVNVNKVGQYKVKYTVADNRSRRVYEEKTRTVKVVSTSENNGSSSGNSGSNGTNPDDSKLDNEVTNTGKKFEIILIVFAGILVLALYIVKRRSLSRQS
ncbi:MAG: immunoglobulin-like domain-containing protein, partial [Mycoplasmatales bacterium]